MHHRSYSCDSAHHYQDPSTIYSHLGNGICWAKQKESSHHNRESDAKTIVEEGHSDDKSDYLSYLSSVYSKYSPAVMLQHTGNTARDHMANERTYLAWFRTSLSLVTIGIAIVQLYHMSDTHHKRLGRALGLIFVVVSMLFMCFGCVRYFHAQCALQHGNFPASRGVVTWASFCVLSLFAGMFAVIIMENIKR